MTRIVAFVIAGLLLASCICGAVAGAGYYAVNQTSIDAAVAGIATPVRTPPRPPVTFITPTATPTGNPSELPPTPTAGSGGPVVNRPREQWAASATASSEYANPQFAAIQAVGPPNTRRCDDQETAWASAKKERTEWLELRYSTAVRATGVIVYESFNPGRVVQIDLRDTSGVLHTVFKGKDPTTACPGEFAPVFPPANYLVNAVRVYVEDPTDREQYAEIDAVQLVGVE